jgi:hypothetical protein
MRDASGAAVVCSHVASMGLPIVRATRDEPLEAVDSGWQFLCDRSHADSDAEAQIWSVAEVLALEPSLTGFVDAPVGTRLWRQDKGSPWQLGSTNDSH